MNSRLNSIEVKRQNRRRVFSKLLALSSATKPELASALQLSIPTVGVICDELNGEGLIREDGMQASGGGRRAMRYAPCLDKKVAVGVDITRNHVYLAVINLRGDLIAGERQRFVFENTDAYAASLTDRITAFLEKSQTNPDQVIGTGISVAGIVRADQKGVMYSHVLGLKENNVLNTMPERLYFSPRIRFFNDATAACMAECYTSLNQDSFVFLSLSNSVGGAVVIHNKILHGGSGRCGEIGHMMIVPGGRKCYCGKCGHYDPYGNALLLTEAADGSMQSFFDRLSQKDQALEKVFDEYIEYLALMIYNLHIETDLPVVLGGYVGSYLKPYLPRLRALVADMNIFTETREFIFSSERNVEASAVGAATYFTEAFIDGI